MENFSNSHASWIQRINTENFRNIFSSCHLEASSLTLTGLERSPMESGSPGLEQHLPTTLIWVKRQRPLCGSQSNHHPFIPSFLHPKTSLWLEEEFCLLKYYPPVERWKNELFSIMLLSESFFSSHPLMDASSVWASSQSHKALQGSSGLMKTDRILDIKTI